MADTLYTVICEFRSGTYVSQVHAASVDGALEAWGQRLKLEKPIPRASVRLAAAVLAGGSPTLLEGLEGTTVQEKLTDSDFFNNFEDDFDEDDMALPK